MVAAPPYARAMGKAMLFVVALMMAMAACGDSTAPSTRPPATSTTAETTTTLIESTTTQPTPTTVTTQAVTTTIPPRAEWTILDADLSGGVGYESADGIVLLDYDGNTVAEASGTLGFDPRGPHRVVVLRHGDDVHLGPMRDLSQAIGEPGCSEPVPPHFAGQALFAVCSEGRTVAEFGRVAWEVLEILDTPSPFPDAPEDLPNPMGHWRWVLPSPDGGGLLGQWSGECEIPTAFITSPEHGGWVAAMGQVPWWDAPESTAVGWTPDGTAIVAAHSAGCGVGAEQPGLYLLEPGGKPELWQPIDAEWFLPFTWVATPPDPDGNLREVHMREVLAAMGLPGDCGEPSHGGTDAQSGFEWDERTICVLALDPAAALAELMPEPALSSYEVEGAQVTVHHDIEEDVRHLAIVGDTAYLVTSGADDEETRDAVAALIASVRSVAR